MHGMFCNGRCPGRRSNIHYGGTLATTRFMDVKIDDLRSINDTFNDVQIPARSWDPTLPLWRWRYDVFRIQETGGTNNTLRSIRRIGGVRNTCAPCTLSLSTHAPSSDGSVFTRFDHQGQPLRPYNTPHLTGMSQYNYAHRPYGIRSAPSNAANIQTASHHLEWQSALHHGMIVLERPLGLAVGPDMSPPRIEMNAVILPPQDSGSW